MLSVGAESSLHHHVTEIKKAKIVPYSIIQQAALIL
jgi:hypothetical protein